MSNDSGGRPKCWRCAVCKETIAPGVGVAANSLPSCPFCEATQPGYLAEKPLAEPTLNPFRSPGAAKPTSDRNASGTQAGGGDFSRLNEGDQSLKQAVLTQQPMQGVQPIQETRGPQQPGPVVLGREQQQLLHYQQQLTENQRMYGELKRKYDEQAYWLGSMESNFHAYGQQLRPDQFQQLMRQRMWCRQLWNDLEIVLKQQQGLWHQVIMLGGVSEPQQLLEYDQLLVGSEGQLKQQLEQELHRLRHMQQSSGGPRFGPDQQQQLLGQEAFCQQLQGDLQTVLNRRQEFRQKFMLRGESAPQVSSQGQRTMLHSGQWVPVPEDPEQQRQHQRGVRPKWVLHGGQWILMDPDQQQQRGQAPQHVLQGAENAQRSGGGQQQEEEQRQLQLEQQREEEQRRLKLEQQKEEEQRRLKLEQQREEEQRRLKLEQQQQKERELLQQKHSADAQRKEIKEKHEEIKEGRMDIEGEGVQLKKQEMSQQQQQRENIEQLHKQSEMITKQGEHDQQPKDKQQEIMDQLRNLREKLKVMMQQQQQQGEEGGQQPNHDQQKQNEEEIQMLHQQIRTLELQMLPQKGEDGQQPNHDQQNQHQQQSGVQTPHRESEGGSQQPTDGQQEQEKRMLEQQPTDGQHQPTDNGNVQKMARMWEKISQQDKDKVQQEQQRMQQHREQLEQRRRRDEQLKEDEQNQQDGQRDSFDGMVVCECGTPFHSDARACANPNCGRPRPRSQPQGPPCAYCGVPLIKEGVKKCESCHRKQPEAPTKPAEGPGGTNTPLPPPPPGLDSEQGYGYPNPSQQQPDVAQPHSSAMVVPSTSTLPHTSQSAMVFGKTADITTSIRLHQPIQVHSEENKNLSAAGDKPSATMPPDAEQQQASSTLNPQGSPTTGVSGALPSNQGNDGNENQPPGVPDSARSTKASGQGSHPLSTEDVAAQSQAAASTKQKQTDSLDDNHNVTAGPDAGGETEDTSTTASASGFPEPQSTTKTGNDTVNHPLADDDHGSGGDPNDEKSEKSREEGGEDKSYAAIAATKKKVLLILNNQLICSSQHACKIPKFVYSIFIDTLAENHV